MRQNGFLEKRQTEPKTEDWLPCGTGAARRKSFPLKRMPQASRRTHEVRRIAQAADTAAGCSCLAGGDVAPISRLLPDPVSDERGQNRDLLLQVIDSMVEIFYTGAQTVFTGDFPN